MRSRKVINLLMFGLTGFCALMSVGILFFVLGYLLWNGGRSLDWDFFTKLPTPVGELGGGMANAIVGSGKLLLFSTLLGVPVGVLAGIYLAEFGGITFPVIVRYTTDLLNGVPSIVMGIFAYAVIVMPQHHFSTFAGGVALGVMMIPIAVRSTEEFLRAVPHSLREAAAAVGASKSRAVFTVVVPAAMKGIVTGTMLDLARVAGETAPLLFTSFNNRFWSSGWNEPTASLPVMIFTYAIGPYKDWHQQAWAAGFILVMAVLAVNICAKLILSEGGRLRGHF